MKAVETKRLKTALRRKLKLFVSVVDRARAHSGGRVRGSTIRRVASPAEIHPACPKEGKSATGGAFGRPFFVFLDHDNGPSQGPASKGALGLVTSCLPFPQCLAPKAAE